jgi:hypothetical protein
MDTYDEWGRLGVVPEAGNRAGIYTTGGELRRNGVDPLSLGLLDIGTAVRRRDEQVEVPVLPNVALSLIVPGEVQLIRAKPNVFRRNHPVLAASVFQDEHPKQWMDRLAEFDQAVLVYTPRRPGDFPTLGEWMSYWHIGLVPVAYRADFDGFSLHPAGTKITGKLGGTK